MIEQWRSFLANEMGAGGNRESVPEAGAYLCDLSRLGLLAVRGEDAASFLQNQLTNDVREVTNGQAQLSGYCNPKGRLLATLLLFRAGDTFYMQLPADLAEPIARRLRMYVLRSKVAVSDAGDELVRFGLWGQAARSLTATVTGQVPEQPYALQQDGQMWILSLPGPVPRYEIISGLEDAQQTWSKWCATASQRDLAMWAALDIEAGIPGVLPTTSEAFVPHSMNLDLLGGVSFTKGCYPGQEVVARMHYLGTPKRRTYRAGVDSQALAQVGTDLYSGADGSAQSAGKVVAVSNGEDGSAELLVVLRNSARDSGDVRLGKVDGPPLTFLPLPYSLQA